jgi:hypothetical protein
MALGVEQTMSYRVTFTLCVAWFLLCLSGCFCCVAGSLEWRHSYTAQHSDGRLTDGYIMFLDQGKIGLQVDSQSYTPHATKPIGSAWGFGYWEQHFPQSVPGDTYFLSRRWWMPGWIPGLLLLVLAICPLWLWVWPVERRRLRRERGLCIRCGYDLQCSEGACSECGLHRPREQDPVTPDESYYCGDETASESIIGSRRSAPLSRWKRWLYPELARFADKRERKAALKQAWRAQRWLVVLLSFPLNLLPWALGMAVFHLIRRHQINQSSSFDIAAFALPFFATFGVFQCVLFWSTLTFGLRRRIRRQLASLSVQVKCPSCGYDLQGHVAKASSHEHICCPECGRETSARI